MGGGVVQRDRVKLWRCSCCGKWSHAKRRPSYHKRFISDTYDHATGEDIEAVDAAAEQGLRVLEHVMERQTAVDDFDPGGAYVACGPFEMWVARRVVPQQQ